MKRCSQCQAPPQSEGGPNFKYVNFNKDFVQIRCGCGLHTGWYKTELEAQKEWKDDKKVTGWSK
jgi:hypothetical protein